MAHRPWSPTRTLAESDSTTNGRVRSRGTEPRTEGARPSVVSSRPLVRGWKLIVASTVIFSSWLLVFGIFLERQAADAGEAIDLARVAQLRPPAESQFAILESGGTPIGYSWEQLQEIDVNGRTRYEITARSKLRADVGGTAVDTALQYVAVVDDRFRLLTFRGAARLGPLEYSVRGTVSGRALAVDLTGPDGPQQQTLTLTDDLYLPLAALPYLATARFEPGKTYTLETFSPVSFSRQAVRVRVHGIEPKPLRGKSVQTTKLEVTLAGVTTFMYVTNTGERVFEESADGRVVARAAPQEEAIRLDRTLGIPTPKLPPL